MLGTVVFRLSPASATEERGQSRYYISQEAKQPALQLSLQIVCTTPASAGLYKDICSRYLCFGKAKT